MLLAKCRLIKASILILVILFSKATLGQEQNIISQRNNAIHFDLLGYASLLSVNYERAIVLSPHLFLSLNIGLGMNSNLGVGNEGWGIVTIPQHFTANIGGRGHYLEGGLSAAAWIINSQTYLISPLVGYKFWPSGERRFYFRFALQIAAFYDNNQDAFYYPFHLGMGFTFR